MSGSETRGAEAKGHAQLRTKKDDTEGLRQKNEECVNALLFVDS